jgi:hypothetical protein
VEASAAAAEVASEEAAAALVAATEEVSEAADKLKDKRLDMIISTRRLFRITSLTEN